MYITDGNVKWYSCCGKQYGSSTKKVKIGLSFDPAIPLLGIHPKELKAGTHKYLYSHIHSSVILSSQRMEASKCPCKTKSSLKLSSSAKFTINLSIRKKIILFLVPHLLSLRLKEKGRIETKQDPKGHFWVQKTFRVPYFLFIGKRLQFS